MNKESINDGAIDNIWAALLLLSRIETRRLSTLKLSLNYPDGYFNFCLCVTNASIFELLFYVSVKIGISF